MPASGVNFSGAIARVSSAVSTIGLRLGIERQIAALLDQRARQRLDENPLRQRHRARLALADIAGFVLGGERDHHLAPAQG